MSAAPERQLVLQAQANGFWDARTATTRLKGAASVSMLDELQQRETIFLAELAEQRRRMRELEQKLLSVAAPTLAAAAAPSPSAPATVDLEEALNEAQLALEEVTVQRELDVQRVGAFWLDKLQAARAETAAVGASAEAPAAAAAVQDETAEQLRAQYEEQAAAAALQAERQLQATSAFWAERAAALQGRAAVSDARVATLEAALAAQTELAESHAASAGAFSAALDERELRAERELQSAATFWLGRLRQAKLGEEQPLEAAARRRRILESAVEMGADSSLAMAEAAAAVDAAGEPDVAKVGEQGEASVAAAAAAAADPKLAAVEEARLKVAMLQVKARGGLAEKTALERAAEAAEAAGVAGDVVREARALINTR